MWLFKSTFKRAVSIYNKKDIKNQSNGFNIWKYTSDDKRPKYKLYRNYLIKRNYEIISTFIQSSNANSWRFVVDNPLPWDTNGKYRSTLIGQAMWQNQFKWYFILCFFCMF